MNNCWFTVLKLKLWDFSKRVQWTDSRRNHAVFMFSHLLYFWSESLLFLHHRKLNPVSQGRKALLDFVGCWGRVEGHRETGAEVAFIAPSPCPSTWWWSPLVACGTIFLRLSCDKVYVMALYICVWIIIESILLTWYHVKDVFKIPWCLSVVWYFRLMQWPSLPW